MDSLLEALTVVWSLLPTVSIFVRVSVRRRLAVALLLALAYAAVVTLAFAGGSRFRGDVDLALLGPVLIYSVAGGLLRGRGAGVWIARVQALAALLAAPIFAFGVFGEAAVPLRNELPRLPEGVEVIREVASCGSSTCARELYLRGDASVSELASAFGLEGASCRPYGWLLDRRRLCTYVQDRGANPVLVVSMSDRN